MTDKEKDRKDERPKPSGSSPTETAAQSVHSKSSRSTPSDEVKELERKIKLLEQQLEYEKFKATAYSTMIDVAEEQLHISIRKKLVAKQ